MKGGEIQIETEAERKRLRDILPGRCGQTDSQPAIWRDRGELQ